MCTPEPSRVLNAVIAGPLNVAPEPVLLYCTLGVVADASMAAGVVAGTTGRR
jgi:hypothetical protein